MNRYYPHTIIAQEGWPFILGGLVLSILFTFLCGWWSAPFWVFTLFSLQFFRDPVRDIPDAPDAILSPADGRVVVVEKAIDPYRNTEALKISVFMNVFNVHSQRSPATGKVTQVQYNAGKFLNAALDKASTENERNAVLLDTQSGHAITFVQVAGLVARRVLCYVKANESMVRGERYGFIRFGSRVDVYLPVNATANVAIGDKVRASETILAHLPEAVIQMTEKSVDVDVKEKEEVHQSQQENLSPVIEADVSALVAPAVADAEALTRETEAIRIQAEAEIARVKAEAEERVRIEAEARAKAEAEAAAERAHAEAEAKARLEAEAAQVQAAEEARMRAEAEERARLEAEAAKIKAAEEAKARLEAEAKAAAEEQARLEIEAKALAEQEQARLEAEAQLRAEVESQTAMQQEAEITQEESVETVKNTESEDSFRKAEEEALAEIAARKPIVRREVFASVPEPWQTIEPSEIIIKTEVKHGK